MSECPDSVELEHYRRGELTAEGAERLECHARACSACRARWPELDRTATLLDDVRVVLRREAGASTPGPPASLEGQCFAHYRVVELMGEGGMARVYRAEDTRTGDAVALKVLKGELLASEDICARFEREARAMSCLRHPHVVTIYDCPRAWGTTGIAMELLEGGCLRDRLDGKPVGREALAEVRHFAQQVAHGLAAAHRTGLVHRDIKPSNLMFTAEGALKIVDFGVVQVVEAATWITGVGHHIGTPAYMSPEQCEGRRASAASDVYSLGVTLYEWLTGRVPFEVEGGSPFAQMLKHLSEVPMDVRARNPAVPEGLAEVVMRCLCKEPAGRYGDGAALAEALAGAEDRGTRTASPRPTPSSGGVNLGLLREQLKRLPQRSIVAWACRRARGVQRLNPDPRLESAIAMAETVARGAAEERSTAKALQRIQRLRAASLKAAYTELAGMRDTAAAQAALAAAAASACAAARGADDAAADAAFVAQCALNALREDVVAVRAFWKTARRDYAALLEAHFGREGTVGDPVPPAFWSLRDRASRRG